MAKKGAAERALAEMEAEHMDEHDKRAREVVPHLPGAAGAYRQEIEQRIASALRATHDAAVAAERERWRPLASAARAVDAAMWAVSIEAGVYAENGRGPEARLLINEAFAAMDALRAACDCGD